MARAAAALMALQIPAVMHKRRDRECLEFLQISPAVRTIDLCLFLGFSLGSLCVTFSISCVFLEIKRGF